MFKVFRRIDGRLLSFSQHEFSIEYVEKMENFPSLEGSKLFAFKTLEDAEYYADIGLKAKLSPIESIEIWEIQIVPYIVPSGITSKNLIGLYWKHYPTMHDAFEVWTPPKGTIWIDSATPLRRIPYDLVT